MRTFAKTIVLAAFVPIATLADESLLFREICYKGKLSDSEARFTIDIDVESTSRNRASAPLFEGDVAVFAPRLPGNLKLVREGNRYRLLALRPGRYRFNLDLIAKITRAEPWNNTSFIGPTAAIASVGAQASGAGMEVQLLSGTLAETETNAGIARVRGFLGPDRVLSLRWQSKAAEAAHKAVVTCETTVSAQFAATVLKYVTQFHYEIAQGNVAKLIVTLPPAQALTRVEGEQIRDWQITQSANGQQLLNVEFIKPVEKSYELTLFSEQTIDTTPFTGQLAPPQPQDVTRESGTLSISAEDTRVEIESAAGLRQINTLTNAIAAYQFYARPFTLAVKLQRVEPVVTASDRVAARLEESRLLTHHSLTLDVERAGIYAVTLSPLAGALVSEVHGDVVEDWHVEGDKLTVNFANRVLGTRTIDIQLEATLKNLPDTIRLAPLRVATATKESTQISAVAAPGIRLKTKESDGLRGIPAAEALGYVAEQPDWKLTLDVEVLDPRLLADIFNLVTVGDGLVGGSATIRYVILNQGVQELRVRVPEHCKNVEFTGPNIRRKEQTNDVWTIALQEKAWGGYTLVVTYDFEFDPHRATLPVGGIHALGVERETGSMAIATAASLQLREKTASDSLHRIDESELAEADRALITRPVLLAYKYEGAADDLAVDVTRFEESAVLQAVADRTQLTTVLTDAGQLLTQASFMVKNNDKQFQTFTLPVGADFWACYVAGQPVKPERDGDKVLVPLPRGANRDQAIAVDIMYAQKIGSLKTILPREVSLVAPHTDIQTTYAEWELFAPESHGLGNFGGNMTVARGTTYSLRDAWRECLRFYDHVYRNTAPLLGLFLFVFAIAAVVIVAVRRGWRGLITTLVVVAIMAILAGMLLPALNQAREKARRANTVSNLRQVGVSLEMFADQHGGQLPTTLDQVAPNDRIIRDVETGERFSYLGAGHKWQDASGDAILAFTAGEHNGGREVLLSDGHVEWMHRDKFAELLQHTGFAGPTESLGVAASLEPPPLGLPTTGAKSTVTAGIRPIRIEIPRTGTRFVFTKVLNVHDEPLSIAALAIESHVRDVTRSSVQLTAFLAGLALVWWQMRKRATTMVSSLIVTIGLALIIGGVTSALIAARLLRVALILAMPMPVVALLVWLARKFWKRLAVTPEPSTGNAPGVPPVVAAIVLMLFLAGSAHASDVSILTANYVGAVHERAAEFEATLHLSAASAGQTVPLFGHEVAVEQFTATTSDVKLVRDGKTVSVALGKRRTATVKVRFLVKLSGDVAKRQLAFAIPPAVSSRVALSINEPGVAVEMPSAVSFKAATDKQQTHVEAVIGSGERIDLRWTPRLKSASETAATIFCQNATLVRIGGGVINTRAQFDYSVTQGELRQVRVRLPAGHRLLHVYGDFIRTWELKEDGEMQMVSVELLKGVTPSFRLIVETERPLEVLPTVADVEAPHALDVNRETGLLALSGSEEVILTVESARELQRVDTEEFSHVAATEPPSVVSVYRFLKPEFALRVRAETVQPQIEAVVHNQIHVGEELLSVHSQVDYTIKRAGVFALRLALPVGYRLAEVNGEKIAQWTTKPGGELEVAFKERTAGNYQLHIQLVRWEKELPKTLALEGVHPLGTQKLTEFVSVGTDLGIQVRTTDFEGLAEIPASEVGVLAYKFIAVENAAQPAWKLVVATEAVEPWVRAEVMNWFSLGDTLVNGRALVRYEIQNAPVNELRLRVPSTFKNVEINGANIRRQDHEDDEWRVELQSKVSGVYTLTVTWEQSRNTKDSELELAGPEVLGVERETGALAIVARPPLHVAEKAASSDVLRIDARELPEWVGRAEDATVMAYRYLRPKYHLALATRRYDEAEVLQALVDNARLTTVVADDGQLMTQMSLSVRNNARQYLEIALPSGAQVWSAFVAGRAVRPSLRGGKLVLSLENAGTDNATVTVELTYVGAERFPRDHGRVDFTSPSLDVPLKNVRWEFYLPSDYLYDRFTGTMNHEHETTPIRSAFDLGEYVKVEAKKKKAVLSELSSALSMARGKLASGQLREATEAYNRARSVSGSYSAQREEFRTLEKDLKQAQGGNLLNAQRTMAPGAPAPQSSARYDADAAEKQWDKLQAAQEVAVAKVLPLRVNLPTQGVRHAFTQVLQTEVGKPMTVEFVATNDRGAGWPKKIGLSAAGFVALWMAVAGVCVRRERQATASV
jgi:Tfp pilus assembly protein PilE